MTNEEFVKLVIRSLSGYEVEWMSGDRWFVALNLVMTEEEGRALSDLLTERPKVQ